MAERKQIVTCVVCGLDNVFPIPEGVLPASEMKLKAGDIVTMARIDEELGVGVCDREECSYKIEKWDSGDTSFDYLN